MTEIFTFNKINIISLSIYNTIVFFFILPWLPLLLFFHLLLFPLIYVYKGEVLQVQLLWYQCRQHSLLFLFCCTHALQEQSLMMKLQSHRQPVNILYFIIA